MNAPDIISTAKTVLSDPQFQTSFPVPLSPPENQPPPEWLKSMLQHVGDSLKWLSELLPAGPTSPDGIMGVLNGLGTAVQVILFIILLFVAVMITIAAYRWLAPRIRNLQRSGQPGGNKSQQPDVSGRTDMLAAARKFIDAGDLDAAAACLFRAALSTVLDDEERQKRRSQTARRLVGQFQGSEPTRHLLQRLVHLREAVHYAGRELSLQEFETAFEEVGTLIRGQRTA